MDFNKISKKEQPLLKRSEAVYTVACDGATTSRLQIAQSLSAKEKGTVVVTHIYPHNGGQTATVHARIYHDEAVAASLERANMLAKQKPKPAAEAQ
jgi:ribosomal protein S24E